MVVLKGYGNGQNSETFTLNGEFQPGYWKFFLYLHTGGSSYLYQATGQFDVMVDCTPAEKYTTPLLGKVSAHSTGVSGGYGKMIALEPSLLIVDPTTSVKLALYPCSVITPLTSDYALGVNL